MQELTARSNLASEFMESDLHLDFVNAMILAGDQLTEERSRNWVESGQMMPLEALSYVGSYNRFNFAYELDEQGKLPPGWFLDNILELWRDSDPDDTDERFLTAWRSAWIRNGYKYLRDGKALPRKKYLQIWRGQIENKPIGCSWSTDRRIAEGFARSGGLRQNRTDGVLYGYQVLRRDIIAYITGRGESEVIINPQYLRVMT